MIKNLEIENLKVRGQVNTGGVAGFTKDTTLENIKIKGKSEVVGVQRVGGVVGYGDASLKTLVFLGQSKAITALAV